MKRVFVLFIVVCLCLCFCGCVRTEPEIDPNLVTLEVTYCDPGTVSAEISNNYKFGIEFGSEYELEYLEGEDWIPVAERTETFFTAIAYGIASGEKNVLSFNIEARYGALSNGKYRIAKDISLLNEDGIGCGSQRVYAEFEITAIERTAEAAQQNLNITAEGYGWNRAFGAKISNKSDREIRLSAMWELFYEVDGEFKKHFYIREIGHDDTMITIAPGENCEASENSEGAYGLLPIGKYRIDYRIVFDNDAGFENEQTVSAEFKITGLEKNGTSFLWEKTSDIYGAVIKTTFCNDWGNEIRYGEDYFIQRFEGEDWVTVEPIGTPAFDQVLYTLNAGETAQWSTDISLIYGNLPAGSYRLVKSIFTDADNYVNGEHYVFFEFEIK